MSFAKIQKQTGINPRDSFDIIKKNNIKTRTKGGIDEIDINDVIQQYKSLVPVPEIAKIYKVHPRTIYNYLEKAGVPRDIVYKNTSFNHDYFQDIDSYDKAYFLGFMITDGNVGKSSNRIALSLSEKDKDILEVFREKTSNENPLKISIREGRINKEVTFHVGSKKMKKDLAKYNVVPNKTLIIEPPQDIRDDLISHLIRGLIDGDGYISYKTRHVGFCGNEKMVTYVRDVLCEKLDVYHVKVIQSGEHLWQISWGGRKDIEKIGEYIYQDKHECYLQRKYDNYLKIIS